MNNAPAGGIYVLSHTPGGYIHIHTPQSPVVIPNSIQNSLLKPNKPYSSFDICCEIMQMSSKGLQIHKQATDKLVLSALSHTFLLNALSHLNLRDV